MDVPQREPDELAATLSIEYGQRLEAFARRRLRDAAAAEDVAQETLRRALVALREKRVANLAALPGFLFETARHICQHRLRSAGRESRALERGAGAMGGQPRADPLGRLLTEEDARRIRQGLASLTSEDRDVLVWSYRDGLDAAAIGARLGIQAGTVRVRRHRALQRLREAFRVTLADNRQP